MFASCEDAVATAAGDIVLIQDLESGLVFNSAFREELVQYDPDYQNEQAVSLVFQAHLTEVTAIIRQFFQGARLIEVGCGKGHFLEHLSGQGFAVTGFDPAYEGVNPNIVKSYFTPYQGLRAEGVILRHVLEHVPDPVAFLKKIAEANGGSGLVYIEVPCFDWILERKGWFDVFYEHVNYFRLSDFHRMFGKVVDSGRIFGSQYLYIVADLATLREPRFDAADRLAFPSDFCSSIEQFAELLKVTRGESKLPIVVWGGASKGVIFSLFMKRRGVDVDYVVDINPAKQGKYLASTGYRVSSPEEVIPHLPANALVCVMNGNYLSEIKTATSHKFNYLTVEHGIV